jgi:tetratricopeptide (TPR) repeat protein
LIETVHGRGYRFIGVLGEPALAGAPARPGAPLVGREVALRRLGRCFDDAAREIRRRVVFVSGEPGIGKTALVEAFFSGLRDGGGALCTHGQCVAGYGVSESYLPLLEAIGRLCRRPGGVRWVELLERHAPTWLVEVPGLLDLPRLARLRTSAIRVNRDRMLRELADAVEAICAEQPLVLLLEDLHWSDAATLDAIDMLARRTERARLLVLGTHRPVASNDERGETVRLAALRAELQLQELCDDLSLPLLTREHTRTYLGHRFPGLEALGPLSEAVFDRSEGNPLMMVSQTSQLVREGRVVEQGSQWRLEGTTTDLDVPLGVRQMIEHQIDQLTGAQQQALESASVAGQHFSSDVVEGLETTPGDLDGHLIRVSREFGLIQTQGEQRRFVHSLLQEILYERLAPARRRRLHLQLGLHLERGTAGRGTASIAPELAMHFDRGGDAERAIRYLGYTADLAIQRCTHEEAVVLLRRALALVETRTDGPSRFQQEFGLLARLGNCLTMTKGYVDPEVRDTFRRAFELSTRIADDTPELMSVLAGLCGFYEVRGDHPAAARIALQQMQLAERTGAPYDRVVASLSRAITCFSVGRYEEAEGHFFVCWKNYDPESHGPAAKPTATDPGVQCLGHGSLVLAARGSLDEARRWSREAAALAGRHGHVPSEVLSWFYAMMLYQLLQDVDEAEAAAASCLALSNEHGFPFYIPAALVVSGWALARRGRAQEGAQQAAGGVALLKAAGAANGQPLWHSILAEAHTAAGNIEPALEAVAEGLAIVEATGEIASESALHWVEGDLVLARGAETEGLGLEERAERCFRRGIDVARHCGAPAQTLGPVISLARLWRDGGRTDDAKRLLEESTRPFSAAVDVPVLREAKTLLGGL